MRAVAVVLAFVMLGGCAAANRLENLIARGIEEYCDLPPLGRGVVESEVNRIIDPNRIDVTCQ